MINIEELVADCVLQNPVEIEIGGKKHLVAKPTLGTLIEASAHMSAMSELGTIDVNNATSEQVIAYCMVNAKNCENIALVLATLILGRKGKKNAAEGKCNRFLGVFKRKERDEYAEVAERILSTMSCEEILELYAKLLGLQNLAFFLSLTTSLTEVNLLKKTKR
jgi:hypothetical protein